MPFQLHKHQLIIHEITIKIFKKPSFPFFLRWVSYKHQINLKNISSSNKKRLTLAWSFDALLQQQ